MTIDRVIKQVAELKPNAYSDTAKAAWISELEGRISREIMHLGEPVGYEYPRDGGKELLVAAPYDNVYELYVSSMIDFYNREYGEYNNSMVMFGRALNEFAVWYIRNHMPPDPGYYEGVV